jgi:HEAT repeat protein
MQLIKQQAYAYEGFASTGGESLAEFRKQFQILYESTPIRAIKLLFHYLSARGVDPVAHAMAFWATCGTMYISFLLEADLLKQDNLTPATIGNAIAVLPEVDPQFLIKFARSVAALTDPAAIMRALRLAAMLVDGSILIPWLRSMTGHGDTRVRASSAKLLCQLRPNKGLIQRHLRSRDARVRASVMEALWGSKIVRTDQDLLSLLRTAIADPNHRVVANALVGLYRLGESEALQKMIALCSTKQQLFRAAMAWAMGVVDDSRAIPALERLSFDPSFIVRQRAADSLLALGYLNTVENADISDTASVFRPVFRANTQGVTSLHALT